MKRIFFVITTLLTTTIPLTTFAMEQQDKSTPENTTKNLGVLTLEELEELDEKTIDELISLLEQNTAYRRSIEKEGILINSEEYNRKYQAIKEEIGRTSIFDVNENVDQIKSYLQNEYPTNFSDDSTKDDLLIVFENLHRKYIYILEHEKIINQLMENLYTVAAFVRKSPNGLESWLKHHREETCLSELLEIVKKLNKQIDNCFKRLFYKEGLWTETEINRLLLESLQTT